MTEVLAGIGILVTRPQAQADGLAQRVREAGGEPVLFPGLEIEPIAQEGATGIAAAQVDLAIFASPNAVRFGVPLLEAGGGLGRYRRFAAIGPGTTAELKRRGLRNIITPGAGHDSEALLAELSGKRPGRVLIVRGQGGRELLGDELRARGAQVEYLECYRRARPAGGMDALLESTMRERIRACVATSASIVENLFAMAGIDGTPWLRGLVFFVPHPRVAASAFRQRAQTVFVTGNGDEALVRGMTTWFAGVCPAH